MKKILVTLSLICSVALVSVAQTTPATTSKATTTTTTTTSSSTTKKASCHKGGNCKKGAKNCTKAGADSKAQKSTTTGASSN